MDPIPLWFLGFIAVMIVINVIRNMINPPRDLNWLEVPQQVQAAVTDHFPDFKVTTVRYTPVGRKYKMRGSYRDRDVEGNSDGSIREIELEDLQHGEMIRSSPVSFDTLPEVVTEHLKTLIGPDLATLKTRRLTKGEFKNEPAYTVEGRTSNASWEVEITEAGRLIELEAKPRK